jgi:hypothetical protein
VILEGILQEHIVIPREGNDMLSVLGLGLLKELISPTQYVPRHTTTIVEQIAQYQPCLNTVFVVIVTDSSE